MITNDGFPDIFVDEWIPATAANIALAENHAVPAGYTKVPEEQASPDRR